MSTSTFFPSVFVLLLSVFFFFNDTATTEIYTLSLHDALPIWIHRPGPSTRRDRGPSPARRNRSEEHTSELQSLRHLVCRLLLEKKKNEYMTGQNKTEVDGRNERLARPA